MKYRWFSSLFFVVPIAILLMSAGEDVFEKGLGFYKEKKFLLAIGAFRNAAELGNKDPKLYLLLGNSYVGIDDYDKAIESYQKGLQSGLPLAYYGVYYFNLGYTYGLKKLYQQAVVTFDQALAYDTNLTHAYWYKGMLYYKMRDRTNTIREWETYLVVNPTGPQSDNIRRALELLRDPNFNFPDDLVKNPMERLTNTESVVAEPLIDISGALGDYKPEDKGKAEDTSVEDIEK
ncbi:tetratricopeptide repeat protein [Thermospira aquatica]|uniref:Tetratricopeptide repeat protein n=1 Tax=Thermospira aquatica TaxID=2828656 RepID=A0AAX3BFC0_9SPIR|nr:tetratricopeptide repeat protein [Thermospira aquatica]URA10970.1 tetratricopeptide repeat protein [Thermospira aquatica]